MAWSTEGKKGTVATRNTVRVKQNDCVETAEIHFKRAHPKNIVNFHQSLQVDLLPCAVNVDSTKPQIFVGHDSGSGDGAYVFELEDTSQGPGKYKFSLERGGKMLELGLFLARLANIRILTIKKGSRRKRK